MAANCEKVVSDLFAAWARFDLDGIMSYFAEDAVWDNVPMAPQSRSWRVRPRVGRTAASLASAPAADARAAAPRAIKLPLSPSRQSISLLR